MVEIVNLCLEVDNKNEVIHSKDVVVKAIDAITLLDKMNHQMTFERKVEKQDHSDSKWVLGEWFGW